ncbi:MAG: hypothetical protein H7840_09390 [Alphaproteobacteria bacterium]
MTRDDETGDVETRDDHTTASTTREPQRLPWRTPVVRSFDPRRAMTGQSSQDDASFNLS